MCSWDKLWTIMNNKIQKDQNPNCNSWGARSKNRVLGAKAGYCSCTLHIAPPRRWADHLSHLSGQTRGPTPTLTPYKEPACPLSQSEQETLFLVFSPSCCSRSPNKALHEFLVWPLINFYLLRRPRTQVGKILLWILVAVFEPGGHYVDQPSLNVFILNPMSTSANRISPSRLLTPPPIMLHTEGFTCKSRIFFLQRTMGTFSL